VSSRSNHAYRVLQSPLGRRETLNTGLVQPPRVYAIIRTSSQRPRPTADCARTRKAAKGNNRLSEAFVS